MDTQRSGVTLTRESVVATVGEIDDERIAAIIATGATVEALEEAAAWAAGESDVMGEERKPLSGAAAAIYDILAQDTWDEERDRD